MALDPEFIASLLKKEQEKATGVKQSTTGGPRPVQLGPLKWHEATERCGSRNCGSPTRIRVRGIPYCTTHALNILNQIILQELEHVDLSQCNCTAGVHSKGNIHTHDCTMYETTKVAADTTTIDMDNLL